MADPAGIGGTVVANNSIASFCQRLNDCGDHQYLLSYVLSVCILQSLLSGDPVIQRAIYIHKVAPRIAIGLVSKPEQ